MALDQLIGFLFTCELKTEVPQKNMETNLRINMHLFCLPKIRNRVIPQKDEIDKINSLISMGITAPYLRLNPLKPLSLLGSLVYIISDIHMTT